MNAAQAAEMRLCISLRASPLGFIREPRYLIFWTSSIGMPFNVIGVSSSPEVRIDFVFDWLIFSPVGRDLAAMSSIMS